MAKKKQNREMADGIMEGVREVQSYLDQGMTSHGIIEHVRRHHPERVRTVGTFSVPGPGRHSAASVKQLRARLGMSQAIFGQSLGVSAILVQSWERGVREPSPLARRLLDIVSRDPAAWLTSVAAQPQKRSRRAG